MRGWIGFGLAWLMMNGFALVVGGQAYTAWSIRMRNEMYWILFNRPVNRDRADRADEIARGVVRWLRPTLLVTVNLLWIVLVATKWR